ncbi:MAG: DMT family transporter [Clostridia bacterium]|nr:DMT family transporter [Clostridia bacterium]
MNGARGRVKYIVFAFLAAVFYAVNIPFSKLLLERIDPTVMAALLYLGAGIGVGIMSLFMRGDRARYEKLGRSDLPYVIGMIALDIFAPILLMFGLKYGTSSSASLLGNFEIAATAVIALIFFKEAVSKRLWLAIALITLASAILSLNGTESLHFSVGSLFVLLAAVCWGFENNCTRRISSKSTYQIVVLKGIFSGLGSLMIAFIIGESLPFIVYAAALVLGFVSYGLSIFLYVRAQSVLGAAKTSACYAAAPFVGAFLSFVFLRENLTPTFVIALAVMIAGTVLVVLDTLKNERQ